MPVEIRWVDDEKHVLLLAFNGDWTWEELYKIIQAAIQAYESVPHQVDVIYDFRASGKMPGNLLTNAGGLVRRLHPNTCIHYLLLTSVVNQTVSATFLRLYALVSDQHTFMSGGSFDEALERLAIERQKRATRPK